MLTPNDQYFPLQWAYPKTEAERAWDLETGSESVIVAVLDTGLEFPHSDLDARFWMNPDEIGGNGIDDDNNGFVDDVRGWDFVNGDNDPTDDHGFEANGEFIPLGHGTHVSGIVSAETNNFLGVAGTAQVSVMVVKVLDHFGRGTTEWIVAGLDYALQNGAKIVSMSLGSPDPCDFQLRAKLTQLWQDGLVLIAATGNANVESVDCPASHANVIPVGATTSADLRWVEPPDPPNPQEGSNYGAHLRDNGLVAPGEDIFSTVRLQAGEYAYLSGTSMATPFVSGVAALILSRNPLLTNEQVKTILLQSSDDIGEQGPDIYHGYGRLNILRAVLGSENRPYVKMTSPVGGEALSPGVVYVTGYVRESALEPKSVVQVYVDISNKACGVFPNWRPALWSEIDPSRWEIAYDTASYPDCEYTVSAKAWDGANWSNVWSVTILIISEQPPVGP